MPSFDQEVEVDVAQESAWNFVRVIDNWASLFPGYQRHLEIDRDNFIWQIRGESGVWSRLVEFHVHVREWNEPSEVLFELEGKTEPVTGTGRFFLKPLSENRTMMGFELTAEGRGPTAPLLNALLKKFLGEQSKPFLEKLVASIVQAGTDDTETLGTDQKSAAPASAGEPSPRAAQSTERKERTGSATEFPTGPGVIVVQYQAPRTPEFEEWLHGPHYNDLLGQPAVVRVSRFERINTTGPLGSYLALIYSSDLATTMRYRTTAGLREQEAANERGLVRGETYLARMVYDRQRGRFSRLLSRLRNRRR